MSKEYLEVKPEDISKLLYDVYGVPSGICEYIKGMVQRLEAIDNANPSEALECLDKLEECAEGMKDLPKSNWIDLAETEAELDLKIMEWVETIKFELFKGKQALLKAQEPKKYLKWEDLEKLKTKDDVKVKMNDTEFVLVIQTDCLNDIYVQLYKEKEDGICVNLLSDFFRDKELFNNLRLEVLE